MANAKHKRGGKALRRRLGIGMMLLGIVLLLAALALLLYNKYENKEAGETAQAALSVVRDAIEDPSDSALVAEPGEITKVEFDGEDYIGYLSIPSLELELPVMENWSYPKLKIAPCRYSGSVAADNLVICGHNYDRHFGRLKTLTAGAEVTFTDAEGKVTTYAVEMVEIVQPEEIEYVTESEYPLTLYTCTYGGKTRVVVRCSKVASQN